MDTALLKSNEKPKDTYLLSLRGKQHKLSVRASPPAEEKVVAYLFVAE